jgi:sugar lactone lactonase YvrE
LPTGASRGGTQPRFLKRDGRRIGVIRWPEQAVNFAFGGPDLRTLFCCAHTAVYTLRVKVAGNSHPWYKRRGQ